MTTRVCQVCGNRNHISKMKKVGTRYACSSWIPAHDCTGEAEDMQDAIKSGAGRAGYLKAKRSENFWSMLFIFSPFVAGIGLIFLDKFSKVVEESVGVSPEVQTDVAVVSLGCIIVFVSLVYVYKKVKKLLTS